MSYLSFEKWLTIGISSMTTKLQILRKKYASWCDCATLSRFQNPAIPNPGSSSASRCCLPHSFLAVMRAPALPVVGTGRFYLWTAVDNFKRLHMLCYFIKPSPTTNTSQTKDSLNIERKMQFSKVVLFLASMFAIVLAAPHANVSMDSSTTGTYIWSSFIPFLERGDSSSDSRTLFKS